MDDLPIPLIIPPIDPSPSLGPIMLLDPPLMRLGPGWLGLKWGGVITCGLLGCGMDDGKPLPPMSVDPEARIAWTVAAAPGIGASWTCGRGLDWSNL